MSIPANSLRVVIKGTLATSEKFNTGFWMKDVPIGGATAANAAATAIAGHFTAAGVTSNIAAMIRSNSSFDDLTVYAYGGGSGATFVGTAHLGVTGTGSAATMPLQTCAVVTLQTPLAGRKFRGRMYLPAQAWALDSGSNFSVSGLVTPALASLKNFFDACNLDSSLGGTVAVVSNAGSASTTVSQIAMDTRPDVQRRRANNQGGVVKTIVTL